MIQRFSWENIRKKLAFTIKKHRPPASMGRGTAHVHATGISSHVTYIITLNCKKNKLSNKKLYSIQKILSFSVLFRRLQAKTTKEEAAPSPAMGKGCGLGVGDETNTTLIIPYRREEANFFRKI